MLTTLLLALAANPDSLTKAERGLVSHVDAHRQEAVLWTSPPPVIGGRVRYNASPNVSINSLVQYDTESHTIGSNSRLRWIITPTAELFVIYNHDLRDRLDRWSFESNRFLTKFQYTFRR